MDHKKAFFFLKRNIKNPRFLFCYLLNYWKIDFKITALFFSEEDVLEKIRSQYSLIRIGDGEIGLLNDKKLEGTFFSQDPLPLLKNSFLKMIRGYKISSPYILAIPQKYMGYSNEALRREGKLRSWLPLKIMYKIFFPKDMFYADAHLFYAPKFFEQKVLPLVDERPIVFVVNETKIARLENLKLSKKRVFFVSAPKTQAGTEYFRLKKEIKQHLDRIKESSPLLIVSCGPVGKVLVYEFSILGFQGLDLGEGANVLFEEKRIDYLV